MIRISQPAFTLLLVVAVLLGLVSASAATVYYVKPTGDNGNSGLSWAEAKSSIGSAMSAAAYYDQIWIAAGTYVERINMTAGVRLYGGFSGTEASLEERDWRTNVTTIDGNSGGSVIKIDNGPNSWTRVDGFELINGTGTSRADCACGGGIFINDGCFPTIANNRIHDCSADMGGGIFCGSLGASVIVNNIIYGNHFKYNGGGIDAYDCSPIIANNVIYGNTGWYYLSSGGGIACYGPNGYPVLSNNTIVDNSAEENAGAIFVQDVHITLNNNIIAFNNTGVHHTSGASFTWSNNCIYSNSVSGTTNPIGSNGNISEDPDFVARGSNDYHLLNHSPCIDAGDDAAVQSGWLDIDSQA